MVERLVRIEPDGSEIVFLYDDRIPREGLGRARCVRASDVVFDEEQQKWKVVLKNGLVLMGYFASREEAIEEEIKCLERMLVEMPEMVQAMWEEG